MAVYKIRDRRDFTLLVGTGNEQDGSILHGDKTIYHKGHEVKRSY